MKKKEKEEGYKILGMFLEVPKGTENKPTKKKNTKNQRKTHKPPQNLLHLLEKRLSRFLSDLVPRVPADLCRLRPPRFWVEEKAERRESSSKPKVFSGFGMVFWWFLNGFLVVLELFFGGFGMVF